MRIIGFVFGGAVAVTGLLAACSSDDSNGNTGPVGGSGGDASVEASGGMGGTAGVSGNGGTDAGSDEGSAGASGEAGTDGGMAGAAGGDAAIDGGKAAFFGSSENPYGKSFSQWGDTWWQWALAIPAATNPLTGADCNVSQTGDVFFLAGNAGGVETRSCTVPASKALLVPVYPGFCVPCPETEGCGTPKVDALIACADAIYSNLDPAAVWNVTVDGTVLPKEAYVYASSAAPISLESVPAEGALVDCTGTVQPNNCGIPEGPRPLASAGYWSILKPLPAGNHILRIYVKNGTWELDVTYNLTLTP